MGCRSRGRMIRRSGCSSVDPAESTDPLQVAVARLLGYSWPDQEPDGSGWVGG